MGNKSKLVSFIVPEIEKISNPGDIICDIMAGTNSIGYALKKRNIILSNDIQYYSYVIAKTLLSNFTIPSVEEIKKDLNDNIMYNYKNKIFDFFEKNYSDTYFSKKQCVEIDSVRYAISKIDDDDKFYYYLTLLMSSMCKVQSTTGHFAQFLSKENIRTKYLRQMSVLDNFYLKVKSFDNFVTSNYSNMCYNLDYNELFKLNIINKVKCFYLDSPYTTDQYSRFYHILETICKYDYPNLKYKAKYREDRIKSAFCSRKTVHNEFKKIIEFTYNNASNLVISYSNKGVISIDELVSICKSTYQNVKCKELSFSHSSQGSGNISIKEVLIILTQ